MRWMRYVQIAFGAIFGLLTLFLFVVALVRFDADHAGRLFIPLVSGLPGLLVVLMLEAQIRSYRKKDAAVRASIEQCAARVFDAPAPVRPEYDMSVTTTAGMAALAAAWDGSRGSTTVGEYKGVRVQVASHASVAGRQMGEFSHVYSHVCVDVLGAAEPFYLVKQSMGGTVAKMAGVVKDVTIGDEAFDKAWIIHADQALARDVLDPSIRARLDDLQSKVSQVSIDMAQGHMHVVLTRHGLAIRWPGEMTPELAIFMRDLLIDMRTRILAHLEKRAHAGMGQGYRVAAGDAVDVGGGAAGGATASPESEEPAAARMAKG